MEKEPILISNLNQDHPVKKLILISTPFVLTGIAGLILLITGIVYTYHPEKGLLTPTSPASVAWFGDLLFNYSVIAVLSVFPTFAVFYWMRRIISKIVFLVFSAINSIIFFMAAICFFVQPVPEYLGGSLALLCMLINLGLIYVGYAAYKDMKVA
jgi:hypothetical protein